MFCPFYHKDEKPRVINESEKDLIKKKIERKLPLNIYLNTVHQIQNEMMNKSEMIVQHRNSAMSLDYKPPVNYSFNQNTERKSIFDSSSNFNIMPQIEKKFSVTNIANNSTMNSTETKIVSNTNISVCHSRNEARDQFPL